jgi:5-methyltetrahydropteroyltriglutamate--homocysteine methyltransferase
MELFPVTVVGSWPRPKWLLEALKKKREGKISYEEFENIANDAVLIAIKYQEDAGIDIISDGEQRRDNFYSFVADKIEGIELKTVAEFIDFVEDKASFEEMLRRLDVPAFAIRSPIVTNYIKKKTYLALNEAQFLKKHTNKKIKVALPGPYLLTRSSWIKGISDKYYKEKEDLAEEFAKILREEIIALRDAGVDFIQLDEPVLMEVLYGPELSAQTFMCAALTAKENPRDELNFAVEILNKTVQGISGVKIGVHVCRGNWSKQEEALLKGDYYPLLPFLLEMKVDQYVLEFATKRAGDIDVFKDYPTNKELGLGVVNPKTDELEKVEEIVSQVEKALKYFDVNRIYLNPDCGFGTFAEVPITTPQIAFEKLKIMRKAAEILRKKYGEKFT